ncbi:ABC transporter substrate-binding protein [Rhodococcus sp. NPDC058514]|uniref:ABC transporter substrate-binding protein n=1 Tax=unclassified Rhodococcus (in: high G+C Gram-positive bacteria) TaxID=192944 RepID=UPI003666E309
MKSITKTTTAAVAAALLLAGCGSGGGSTSASGTGGDATPVDSGERCTAERVGGTISMGEYFMLPTFAPGQGGFGARGGGQSAAVFDRLMRWDPVTNDYTPKMAESMTADESSTAWTLKLRPNVKFSNGDPVTAEAVKFSVELHRDPALRSSALQDVKSITGIEVVDPTTVKFTLDGPWTTFPYVLAGPAGEVVNPAVYQSMPADQYALNPVGAGAGAYTVKRNAPGEELLLEPNPNYYGGPVCASLRFVMVPGAQATYDALTTGELQTAFLREAPIIAKAKQDGTKGYSELANSGKILVLNNGNGGYTGIATDVRVRKAIAAAVDPDLVDQRINGGTGDPGSTLLSEKSTLFDGTAGPQYDPEQAKKLVAEVKAEKGWDGSLKMLMASTPEGTEQGIVLKALLDAVGFDVKISNVPVAQVTAQTFQGDFEVGTGGMVLRDSQPYAALANFLGTGGSTNMTGFGNPELDTTVAKLKAATSLDEQKQIMGEVQAILNEHQPIISYGSVEEFVAVSPTVKGVVPTLNAVMFFDGAYLEK